MSGTVGETIALLAFWAVVLFVAVTLYFLPTIIARRKKKRNANAITVLNVFLGWTLIGWLAALIWAVTEDAPVQPARPN